MLSNETAFLILQWARLIVLMIVSGVVGWCLCEYHMSKKK